MSAGDSPPAYLATSSARRIALAESLDFSARAHCFTSGRAGFTTTPRRFACFNNFKAAAMRLRASSIIGSGTTGEHPREEPYELVSSLCGSFPAVGCAAVELTSDREVPWDTE